MFGGQTANGEATGELYVLRFSTKGVFWQNGSTLCKGKGPEARFDHTMERLRDNLVVFGGRNRTEFIPSVYLLELGTLTWNRIQLKGGEDGDAFKNVLERAEFSCAGSRYEDRIFIFGGINKSFALTNEVLVLKFDQMIINPLNDGIGGASSRVVAENDQAVNLQFFNVATSG